MKKFFIFLFLISIYQTFAQVNEVTNFNCTSLTGVDTLRPWSTDKGARFITVTNDLDGDGKIEFLVTDYSNGGRVHVLELTPPNTLQLVWSSPAKKYLGNINSTPRWVQFGDFDGDGNKEIVFPFGPRYTGQVQVWECVGNNDYGTAPALTLDASQFTGVLGATSNFRMDREVANVSDFDGDGKSELIMSNQDINIYVLGVLGSFPGFASWQIEGGDPAVVPFNSKRFSASPWHSILINTGLNGTKKTIVNHHWNFWGFWSIKPRGADSYQYPDSLSGYYTEFFKPEGQDMVSYMGIQKVDVNGDKRDEIAGILYGGTGFYSYALGLVSLDVNDTGLYVWNKSKGGVIGSKLWQLVGVNTGSFWGIGAADLNGNGRQEILLGGTNQYTLTSVEYKGTGNLLDSTSYTTSVAWAAPLPYVWYSMEIKDSAGIRKDTVKTESPFVSRMVAGFDSDGDGKQEVALAYQSVYDSVTLKYYHWLVDSAKYNLDSTKKVLNTKQINFRLLESNTAGGIDARELNIITPDDFVLEQNYPNPFNPSTSIRFSLPVDENIVIKIYDMLGNQVATLLSNNMKKGSYEITWNGTNDLGQQVASGNYIAEMKFGNFAKSIKMQLLK